MVVWRTLVITGEINAIAAILLHEQFGYTVAPNGTKDAPAAAAGGGAEFSLWEPSYDVHITYSNRSANGNVSERWRFPRQEGTTRRRVVPYKTFSANLGFYTNKGNGKVERLSQLFGSVVNGQGVQKTKLFGPAGLAGNRTPPHVAHARGAIAQRSLFLPRSDVNLVPLGLPTHDINHNHIHNHNQTHTRSQHGYQASRAARRLCKTLQNNTALAHHTGLQCDGDMVLISRVCRKTPDVACTPGKGACRDPSMDCPKVFLSNDRLFERAFFGLDSVLFPNAHQLATLPFEYVAAEPAAFHTCDLLPPSAK